MVLLVFMQRVTELRKMVAEEFLKVAMLMDWAMQ
jgi:hypothetical protein